MTEAEQEWLDWAVMAGGILDVPMKDASDLALINLIAIGHLTYEGADDDGRNLRYRLTEKLNFRAGLGMGLCKLPDDIGPV